MKLSDWIVYDGCCAVRIIEGSNIGDVANRVAFIEKTPRVRTAPYSTSRAEQGKWKHGPKGCGGSDGDNPENEIYGFFPPSREWCDEQLIKMGYEI